VFCLEAERVVSNDLVVRFEGRAVGFEGIDRPQPKGPVEPRQRTARQPRQPAADHPWRRPLLSPKRKTANA